MTARVERVLFYNLDNNRDTAQVNKEIKALLDLDSPLKERPAVVGFCEAFYSLNSYKGFTKVRNTKNKSRKNIAAYVREDLFGGDVKWHDLKETWSRTNPGATGQHEPRSYVSFLLGQMQFIVLHQPPKQVDNAKAAQKEGIDLLVSLMKPKEDASDKQRSRPRIALGDYNKRKGEPSPGPDDLAERISGANVANKIDTAVRRGDGSIKNESYPEKIGGVTLKSDHGHAFRFDLSVPEKWWAIESG